MFFRGKNPCVVAGLLAGMGLGVALGAAPAVAIAEDANAVLSSEVAVAQVVADADYQQMDSSEIAASGQSMPDDSAVSDSEVTPGIDAADQDAESGDSVADAVDGDSSVAGGPDAKSDSAKNTSSDQETGARVDTKVDEEPDADSNASTAGKSDSGDNVESSENAESETKETEESEANKVISQAADQASIASAENVSESSSYKNQWVKSSDGSYSWYNSKGNLQDSGWVVTSVSFDGSDSGGLKRYWIDSSTKSVAFSRLVDASWNDKGGIVYGYAYATKNGWVAIGKYTETDIKGNALTYLADSKGMLEKTGWVISDAYDGEAQRYYVDEDSHACVQGFSEDGYAHYTTEKGYVVRGGFKASDGSMYYADNNGKLKESGWLVTSDFGQGLQRYWLEDYKVASEGLHQTGSSSWAYVTNKGYVLRGVLASGRIVYIADNDGELAGGSKGGWVVSSDYGQGLQRYWINPEKHAAIAGYDDGSGFEDLGNYAHFTTEDGYVLRGVQYLKDAGRVYLGDNDGRLARGSGADGIGWLVTDAYGQGRQRYWVEYGGWAQVGYSESGWAHYTTTDGYVLRGAGSEGGVKRYADNDGFLKDGWVVTGDFTDGAMQRYYQKGGSLLANTFFKDGGYWAYAKQDSSVLRGKATVGGKLYLADNDGRLVTSTGWKVTGDYDGGGLQRYFFKSDDGKGYSYAVTGAFRANLGGRTSWFYGTPEQGYVVRGKFASSDGVLLADNDGRLAEGDSEGWKVTGDYDNGSLQRYYLYNLASGCPIAKTGFFAAALSGIGSWFYGSLDQGYVLRGKLKTSDGIVLADNDGRIEIGTGFIVSSEYDSSAQRYYLEKTSTGYSVAKTGFFTAKLTNKSSSQWFYGDTNAGYILRGANRYSSGVLLSNQDGVLLESLFANQGANSWLVTDKFDGSAQRYYIIKVDGHLIAKIGKFSAMGEDGKSHNYFGREDTGYVVRGSYVAPDGTAYSADNDGRLIETGWFKTNGSWYYMYSNGTSSQFTNAAYAAWCAIRNMSSNTGYLLAIDNSNFRVVAFTGSAGNWTPVYDWLCSVGVEKTVGNDHFGRTVRGSYTINKKGTMMGNDPDYYYWSEFMTPSNGEEGQRFHSMGYYRQYGTDYTNPDNRGALYDSGLGKAETHGCVRLELDAVKWIYYTCPIGTKVYSY